MKVQQNVAEIVVGDASINKAVLAITVCNIQIIKGNPLLLYLKRTIQLVIYTGKVNIEAKIVKPAPSSREFRLLESSCKQIIAGDCAGEAGDYSLQKRLRKIYREVA